MNALTRLFTRFRRRRADLAGDVDAEIAAHLDERTRQLIAIGMSPEQAAGDALRRFGSLPATRQSMYDSARRHDLRQRRHDRLASWWSDLRDAARQLARSPGFTAGVVLTLALGIGANVAMFDVLDRLLLRPPAHVVDPSRIVRVYLHAVENAVEATSTEVSYRRYGELRDAARAAIDLAAIYEGNVVAGTGESARQVRGALVSGNFWATLGVQPAVGQFFRDQPASGPDGDASIVLGHEYWTSAFGGNPDVVGRSVSVGARSFAIVGVAPPEFSGVGLSRVDVWLPANAALAIFRHLGNEWSSQHGFAWLSLVGRLRDGVSEAQAAAALGAAYRFSLETQGRDGQSARASIWPAQLERGPQRTDATRVALWLGAVAVIVLLLACANVANLMLARGLRRRSEITVRIALGLGRGRLIRQWLLESVLLSGLAAAAGAALAIASGAALRWIILPGVTLADTDVNGRLLFFSALAAAVACLASGLVPALYASRPDVAGMMTTTTRVAGGRSRLRTALLIGQAAMSTMLLVGAGLFVRSLSMARVTDMGFDADRLLVVRIELRGRDPLPGGSARVLREFADRLRTVPGVEGATTTMQVPFAISGSTDIAVPGVENLQRFGEFRLNGVGDDYFQTTGTRILDGRPLEATDRAGSPLVMVVSESMARALWPGRRAVGQCVQVGGPTSPCSEVVGVAADVHQYEVRPEPALQYWFPESQDQGGNSGAFGVLVRTRAPAALVPVVRQALAPIVPANSFVTVRPVAESIDRAIRPWRLGAVMFSLFGAIGLVIAAIGLYSVLAYVVDQRRREIGVRVALGAVPRRLVGRVVADSVVVTSVGVVVGLIAAWLAAPWLSPLLLGVGPRDPVVLGGVALTLIAAAIAAGLVPGWRAARVDPVQVLRD